MLQVVDLYGIEELIPCAEIATKYPPLQYEYKLIKRAVLHMDEYPIVVS